MTQDRGTPAHRVFKLGPLGVFKRSQWKYLQILTFKINELFKEQKKMHQCLRKLIEAFCSWKSSFMSAADAGYRPGVVHVGKD